MSEQDYEKLEQTLRLVRPAQPPEQLMTKLLSARPEFNPPPRTVTRDWYCRPWAGWFRWVVPAAAAGAVVAGVWRSMLPAWPPSPPLLASPALRANDVQINSDLVSAFDAVGLSKDGEPVRYRCQEWMDKIEMRDTQKGVVVQQSVPRLEVVAVGYEVY